MLLRHMPQPPLPLPLCQRCPGLCSGRPSRGFVRVFFEKKNHSVIITATVALLDQQCMNRVATGAAVGGALGASIGARSQIFAGEGLIAGSGLLHAK